MPGPAQRPDTNPFRYLVSSTLKYAGIDQGVDFTGSGNVFAVGDAVITRVQRGGSGWPGEGAVLNYKILTGPKAGQFVYVAEDFAPRADLRPGMIVKKGDAIGTATGSGKAPGIEIGWAQPSGIPLAPRPPARPADQYTRQGADFASFVQGGAGPAPVTPTSIVDNTASVVNGAARHVPGVAQVEDIGSFLGRITDPSYILRGLQIVAGAALVLIGVVLLTRQVGLAVADTDIAKDAVGAADTVVPVSKAAKETQAAGQRSAATEARRSESHASRMELQSARTKTEKARATELRTRTKHRRRTKQEQTKEIDRAYVRGVAESNPLN